LFAGSAAVHCKHEDIVIEDSHCFIKPSSTELIGIVSYGIGTLLSSKYRTSSASTSGYPHATVAATEVRYDDEKTDSEEDSDEEVLERWVAYPQDIQRVLNLQEELERARERERDEQISERGVIPFTDNHGSEDISSITHHMNAEGAATMTTPTPLRIPPFGGAPGENLRNFFRRFDQAVRWVVYPPYPPGEEGKKQKEMDMAGMIQNSLVGKALEESDTFLEAAYESVEAFKEAPRQAFPQSETVVASKEDQRKVKALRFYETQSIIDPETGDRDPPELYVQRAKWFRQYLPDTELGVGTDDHALLLAPPPSPADLHTLPPSSTRSRLLSTLPRLTHNCVHRFERVV
jgi:hypothetical protein